MLSMARSDCGMSPRYQPVISEPKARPKLIDNCCIELAMVLAMLESALSTSAYAMVFMLENCSELKKPMHRLMATITYRGVPTLTCENMAMVTPISTVLTISTWR
ncbi:hypothetical protein D3C81_1984510 [compost metagenome]